MLKRSCSIFLAAVVLYNNALLSGSNSIPPSKVTHAQGTKLGTLKKVFGDIESKARKLYDSILGNDEACTPDEIMLTRVVIFIALLVGYGKIYAIKEARRFAERQRIIQERARFGMTQQDLNNLRVRHTNLIIRQEYNQEYFDGDASRFLHMLGQAMSISFENSNNSSDYIVQVGDTFKNKVKLARQTFFQTHSNSNVPDSCIVCMADTPVDVANIPCFEPNHTAGLCIDCLARLVSDKSPCPLCRGILMDVDE